MVGISAETTFNGAPATGDPLGARPLDLDIGVIYTHERQFIGPLVSSLAGSGDGLAMRLILVDNASKDPVQRWSARFPRTKVIRNEKPLGYAPNLNRVLNASTARYVLVLNTDTYFDPNEQCLAKMVRFMDDNPECGVSVCRIYHPDGTYGYPARKFQTPQIIAGRRLGMQKLFAQQLRDYLYLDEGRYGAFDCDWISGCFMLLRREAVEHVGAFDCGFRKYFEDADLCARMTKAGWRVMFNGGTYFYHYEQRASTQVFSRDAWHHLKSYGRWLLKWKFSLPRMDKSRPVALPAGYRRDDAHAFPPLSHTATSPTVTSAASTANESK
jgi:GT2 family glycosyltransferase